MFEIILYTFLTVSIYMILYIIKKKYKLKYFNPLLISTVILILIVLIFKTDLSVYKNSTKAISYLVGPLTVTFAIPLYKNYEIIKKNIKTIVLFTFSSVIIHGLIIIFFAYIFNYNKELFATFIPKSITTSIAIEVSSNIGGIRDLTAVIVVLTGVIGAMLGPIVFNVLKIDDPVIRGLSLGLSSHVIGSTKASEYGSLDASFASIGLIFGAIATVLLSPLIFKLGLLII